MDLHLWRMEVKETLRKSGLKGLKRLGFNINGDLRGREEQFDFCYYSWFQMAGKFKILLRPIWIPSSWIHFGPKLQYISFSKIFLTLLQSLDLIFSFNNPDLIMRFSMAEI